MNKNFYIFRHALATKNGYPDQNFDVQILAEGVAPITKMARYLVNVQSESNFSSQYLRCKQTVQIISKITGKKFVFDKRLNEYYAESFEKFLARVNNSLEDLLKQADQNIIICTHAAVISVIIQLLKEKRIDQEKVFTHQPKPGTLLIVKNKRVEELDFNKS